MRDIKFRGLTTKGEMIAGSLVVANSFIPHMPKQHTKNWIVTSAFGNGGWFNIRIRQYVKPETVGQFTGLQDKNGVDIYEGDIVKAVSNQHYWLSVVSSEGSGIEGGNLYAMEFCNNLSESEFGDEWTFKKQKSTRRNTINKRMEVVGNIHQNPELLEE